MTGSPAEDGGPAPPSSLSETEARVGAQLLGAGLEAEEERIRATPFARSTYQEAKRRLYARGWLYDRYVPAPSVVGCRQVSFLLARPFAEKLGETARQFQQDPSVVHCWEAEEFLVAVLFHRAPSELRSLRSRLEQGEFGGEPFLLTVDPREPTVPVYFDWEGVWCRWTGSPGPVRFPRPLPTYLARSESATPARPPPPALGPLLARPLEASDTTRALHLRGPATLPRSQRRLLLAGQAEWRVLPDLTRLPEYRGVRLSHLFLVRAQLRRGVRLLDLYRGLLQERGVHPFLLASDRDQVLLGTVQATLAGEPRPEQAQAARDGLVQALATHLEGLQTTRLPAEQLRSPVDHRYDRLILQPASPEGGSGAPGTRA